MPLVLVPLFGSASETSASHTIRVGGVLLCPVALGARPARVRHRTAQKARRRSNRQPTGSHHILTHDYAQDLLDSTGILLYLREHPTITAPSGYLLYIRTWCNDSNRVFCPPSRVISGPSLAVHRINSAYAGVCVLTPCRQSKEEASLLSPRAHSFGDWRLFPLILPVSRETQTCRR